MTLRLLRVVLFGLMVGPEAANGPNAAVPDAAKVRAEIQAATEDWLRTTSSPVDLDGFMRHYHPGPETVFANAGRTWKGWDAIRLLHEKIWAEWTEAKFGYRTITTAVLSSDIAASTIEGDYSITTKIGQPNAGTFVASFVWQRTPAGWRIVQQHESFPRAR